MHIIFYAFKIIVMMMTLDFYTALHYKIKIEVYPHIHKM